MSRHRRFILRRRRIIFTHRRIILRHRNFILPRRNFILRHRIFALPHRKTLLRDQKINIPHRPNPPRHPKNALSEAFFALIHAFLTKTGQIFLFPPRRTVRRRRTRPARDRKVPAMIRVNDRQSRPALARSDRIPTGFQPSAQGCAQRATLGSRSKPSQP